MQTTESCRALSSFGHFAVSDQQNLSRGGEVEATLVNVVQRGGLRRRMVCERSATGSGSMGCRFTHRLDNGRDPTTSFRGKIVQAWAQSRAPQRQGSRRARSARETDTEIPEVICVPS